MEIKKNKTYEFDYVDTKGKRTHRKVQAGDIKGEKMFGHDYNKNAMRCFIMSNMTNVKQVVTPDSEIPF